MNSMNQHSIDLPQDGTKGFHKVRVFLMQILSICLVVGILTKLMMPNGDKLLQSNFVPNSFRNVPVSFASMNPGLRRNDFNRLSDAVNRVRPHWKIPKINSVLHALRLWGKDSRFRDDYNPFSSLTPSGYQLFLMATDNSLADKLGVLPLHSFLYRTKYGITPQFDTGEGGIAHVDQYLKVLGEAGASLESVITLSDGSKSNVAAVVESSLLNFHLDQELEFSAVAYSRWLPPHKEWRNRNGRVFSFDDLANAILSKSIGSSSCHGIHSLYALANIYRAHLEFDILSPNVVVAIESRLHLASELLMRNQSESGLWFGGWTNSSLPSSKLVQEHGFEAVVATGHHLEWIAMTPKELRPAEDSIHKAAGALADLILKHDALTISNSYAPFSHAARSLLLLNDIEPSAIANRAFDQTVNPD
jgi:hypothetical protein